MDVDGDPGWAEVVTDGAGACKEKTKQKGKRRKKNLPVVLGCRCMDADGCGGKHSWVARCRAGSMAECTLMLDYLLYYCLPLPLLTLTLAYVGLCSLLSKLSTVDILLVPQE